MPWNPNDYIGYSEKAGMTDDKQKEAEALAVLMQQLQSNPQAPQVPQNLDSELERKKLMLQQLMGK